MTTTSSPSLNQRLAETYEGGKGHLPSDVSAAFDADREQMVEQGSTASVAEVGTPMPDGALLDTASQQASLAAARGEQPAVVVFYRGSWCPYCNLTLRTYQTDLVPELERRGVRLVAISPQTPDGSITITEAQELTFTVLSDKGSTVAAQLGILTGLGEGAQSAGKSLGLDVAASNADGTAAIPMPTTVVVDAGGTIRWIDVHPNFLTRSEVPDILAAVDALG